MSKRREGRETAIQLLFSRDFTSAGESLDIELFFQNHQLADNIIERMGQISSIYNRPAKTVQLLQLLSDTLSLLPNLPNFPDHLFNNRVNAEQSKINSSALLVNGTEIGSAESETNWLESHLKSIRDLLKEIQVWYSRLPPSPSPEKKGIAPSANTAPAKLERALTKLRNMETIIQIRRRTAHLLTILRDSFNLENLYQAEEELERISILNRSIERRPKTPTKLSGSAAKLKVDKSFDLDIQITQLVSSMQSIKFSIKLYEGVASFLESIDQRLAGVLENFSLDRLTGVDRNILRLAIYEMFHRTDVPPIVVINEAIEISKNFGTPDSSRFVNGVLDRLKQDLTRDLRDVQPQQPRPQGP